MTSYFQGDGHAAYAAPMCTTVSDP